MKKRETRRPGRPVAISGKAGKRGKLKSNISGKVVPYHRKPEEMSLEAWQKALRVQFAEIKTFGIEKLGRDPVFTDYRVTNPENKNVYKVSLRDNLHSMNFCECMDFKTNQLGTCKHIEAVIRKIEGNQRLRKLYRHEHNPEYSSVYLSYARTPVKAVTPYSSHATGNSGVIKPALVRKTGNIQGSQPFLQDSRRVMLRIGETKNRVFTKLAKDYFDEFLVLKPEAYGKFEEFLKKASRADGGFRCYPDALEYVIRMRDELLRESVLTSKYGFPDRNEQFDTLLKTRLFPYQKEGVFFAVRGGRTLIADDMGLGKTIQALATAELMYKELQIRSVLVVCPTSLKYQWKTEISKFTDREITVIEGNPVIRGQQYREMSLYKIVSYHTLVNDLQEICNMMPDLIILDEAQRIKNFRTKVAQAVKKIASPYAIVLTGTPLENKLEELYSVISFVDPYVLGPFHHFLSGHQVTDDKGKVTGYKNLNEIGRSLRNIMIRRKKQEVLTQLPERMDKILLVDVTPQQASIHEEFANAAARIVARWRKFGHLSEQERQRLMILLNEMRMVCDSTYILDQQSRHDTKIEEVMHIISEIMSEGDEKVVIFSQWERMTRLVAGELDKLGAVFECLHGGIPSANRGKLYENFSENKDCRVFLSTDAGGVGLNLQAGSVVINLDIPWNPAVLEQRIARVHRIGQKRKVSVINLVSAGTIEHRMLDVLRFKSSMAAGILDGGEDSIFMGESRFNQFMATVGELVTQDPGLPVSREAETLEPAEPVDLAGEQSPEFSSQLPAAGSLIAKGLEFITEFSATVAQPGGIEKLVDSLVETDPANGKTFLKIPVASKKTIEQAVQLIAALLTANKTGQDQHQ